MRAEFACTSLLVCLFVGPVSADDPPARPQIPLQISPTHQPGSLIDGERSRLPSLVAQASPGPVEPDGTLSWKALAKISVVRHENVNQRYGRGVAYFAEPVVADEVKRLVGRKVRVKGYALPRGTADGVTRMLVSGLPAADPDGCVAGGAETFVSVQVPAVAVPVPVDSVVTVEGTLALFEVDRWSGFIYQLTDARIVDGADKG